MMKESASRTSSYQLILDTAEQIIQEKGCRQTTMQDIIDRSGLSKGAIYHYVSGKNELFGQILKTKMDGMNESFKRSVSETPNGEATPPIRMIAEAIQRNTDRNAVTNKIFTYLLSQTDNPKIEAMMNELHRFNLELSRRWIETGQQAGAIPREIDAAKMAGLFIVFSYGMRTLGTLEQEDGLGSADIFSLISKALR